MIEYTYGDKRIARFEPKQTDDLRPEVVKLIGRTLEFTFYGYDDNGKPEWTIAHKLIMNDPELFSGTFKDEDLVEP